MQLDLSEITQKYFPEVEDPEDINCGRCYQWAWLAYLKTRGQLLTYDDVFGSHAFIRVGDRYYDSSRPQGVESVEHLPFFENEPLTILVTEVSARKFRSYWQVCDIVDPWNVGPWPRRLPKRLPKVQHAGQ